MPTSAPGSNDAARAPRYRSCGGCRGFSLVELLIVIAIIAISVGLVALALPDGDATRLEEEGARLGALLEMARTEARVMGASVRWVPRAPGEADPGSTGSDASAPAAHFRFVGLPPRREPRAEPAWPSRWLDPRTQAQVVGDTSILLGPEAILPPQRVVLSLGDHRLELASDGLGPFAPAQARSGAAP